MPNIKMAKSLSGELVDIITELNHSNALQTMTVDSPKRRLKRFICELCKSTASKNILMALRFNLGFGLLFSLHNASTFFA